MSDFDKAVAQGMGFRVPLSEQEARSGFARVAVLGVRLSATAEHGAAMLEELIDNHQFSPKGFSLVPQGTPTNNTEQQRHRLLRQRSVRRPGVLHRDSIRRRSTRLRPDPLKSQTDGRLLADALGIAYPPLQTVQHADQTDVLEARLDEHGAFSRRRWDTGCRLDVAGRHAGDGAA